MSSHSGDSESGDASSSRTPFSASSSKSTRRPPGACTHCKFLKARPFSFSIRSLRLIAPTPPNQIRCEFIPEENICVRCKSGGHDCVSQGRKKRKAAPTHEDLQERSYSQDLQIQSLLRQLDEIRAHSRTRYWISQAQAEAVALKRQMAQTSSGNRPGVWDQPPSAQAYDPRFVNVQPDVVHVASAPRTIPATHHAARSTLGKSAPSRVSALLV
ncbi:uncharacterized protein FIBRA_05419 [Fibroporia radiculosa]|uniref:Zn(2)-C6 fungal-type domain-containing protein n=1 Tax=Fibroporia radiculosa TaxID=599839 RepID=J4IAP9_9APHY|nr:uncharacterized protein FIBRA_05419 [Fibroporia radiculosa]CCM03291.1 predicted protein [Fibroporia radiculosa]